MNPLKSILESLDNYLKDLQEKNFILGEVVKQSIDQPLHVLMAVGSVWGITVPLTLVGVSDAVSVAMASFLTAGWIGYREYQQWPSSRWWDPYLDWFFEAVGIVLGVWSILVIL